MSESNGGGSWLLGGNAHCHQTDVILKCGQPGGCEILSPRIDVLLIRNSSGYVQYSHALAWILLPPAPPMVEPAAWMCASGHFGLLEVKKPSFKIGCVQVSSWPTRMVFRMFLDVCDHHLVAELHCICMKPRMDALDLRTAEWR